ncbi:Uncharacterised protein [uncultured archaeon]|nr:Uncharacterised protein [uncultured archaeon]
MKRLAILLGIMIFAATSAFAADAGPMIMEGVGTITVPADTVTISATVESSNENLTLAEAEAQEMLNKTVDALKNAGVDQKNIIASQGSGVSSFHLSSKVCRPAANNTTICEYESQSAKKVSKSLLIRLKTTDEASINRVMNAARSSGASAEVFGYGLSDASSAITDARKKAVANAKENAEGMAQAAGARLGKVLDISEYAYPDISMSEQPGMVDVTSYVVVKYEILG